MSVGKRLVNTGVAAAAFDPLQNFETVTYTGNGSTQKITGYIRKGAAFNGSSSYISNSDLPIIGNMARSVSFWFKTTSADGIAVNLGNTTTTGNTQFAIAPQANSIYIYGYVGTYDEQLNGFSTNLLDGNWHHCVITWDGLNPGTLTGYIDETDVVSLTRGVGEAYATYQGLRIGTWYNNANRMFNGKIDQVRIFNKALSSGEVTTLYGETYASSTKSTTDIFNDDSGVALYELDEDANDTGGVSGKFGSAAIFNGSSSKIEVPSKPFTSSTNWSLSYWINWSTSPTSKQYVYYFGNYNLRIEGQSGLNKIVFWDGSAERIVSNAVSLNNWQHITYTYNGTTLTMYVNGSSVDTLSVTSSPVSTSVQETIGAAYDGSGRFNGKLDDLRIYDDVLTSQEVGYIYNNTTASIPTDNLLAYYKLDGDATDETGTYNGTATNVSWGYDGTATNVNYLGMAFQPDLVWIKNRNGYPYASNSHSQIDSVRGSNKILSSNSTAADWTTTDLFTSFDSNGFTLPSNTGTQTNASGGTYVAWCWKAGGAAVSNTDGTITSTVSANQAAGFSIVKWDGTGGTTTQTVGHGLLIAPELIIIKVLGTSAYNWIVYADGKNGYLNTTDNFSTTIPSNGGIGTPNNSVISLVTGSNGNLNNVNWDGVNDIIAYCFHSVDGYQKIGSYTGNGGTLSVTTGFAPRFVMIKPSSLADNWMIYDTSRGKDIVLFPNLPNADTTYAGRFSFLSDGFQLSTSNSGWNGSGSTYIYLAIA